MRLTALTTGVLGLVLIAGLFLSAAPAAAEGAAASEATAIATFHCLSLYWSPPGGEVSKKVLVRFREAGTGNWRDGLPLRYNPVNTPECKGDYRGSIVNLRPGATYELALSLEGSGTQTTLQAATWREDFPISQTIKVASSGKALAIDKSGTAGGYVLYDGRGATIDGANGIDAGITVNASYVILRGFTIRNVKQHGIRIDAGHHIVIEECDVSQWGSEQEKGFGFDYQAGVYSKSRDLHAVVIQRSRFHHPSWDTNSWAEEHNKSRHPAGPQTIVFFESAGNHVIRYNECWSDDEHYFNDVIGGGNNGSYRGFPGADSDIYCNYIANAWDEGIEAEGGNQNVRIWSNYIENTLMTIGNAATSIGPLYVWRNVAGRSHSPEGSSWNLTHGNFLKMGYADGEHWMTGRMYIFNNTLLQPRNEGPSGLGGDSRVIKHCVSRNNILHVRPTDTHSISTDKRSEDNDFDYDLFTGRHPADQEKHGIKAAPQYVPGAGFSFGTKTAILHLAPGSPGQGQGEVIPNFCESASGAPDMGAHQSGTAPMTFGNKARFNPNTR